MANIDSPRGFRPLDGNSRKRPYNKDASASAIYKGDAVKLENDGNVAVAAAGDVIVGFAAEYSAASTAKTDFMVWDDPHAEFIGQDDGDTTTMAQTHVGNCFDILATTGDTTLFTSKHEVDTSSTSAADGQLKLKGITNKPGNSFGANVECIVLPNEHYYSQVAGV